MTLWLVLAVVTAPAFADNVVKLRILVITTGDMAEDLGLAYIKPVLEEMGVPYHLLNAATQDLTVAMLASSPAGTACKAEDAGCLGNYNGIILTDADLVPGFTPRGMGHPAQLPEKLRHPSSGTVRMARNVFGSAASLWRLSGLWACLFVQRKRLRCSMDSACCLQQGSL